MPQISEKNRADTKLDFTPKIVKILQTSNFVKKKRSRRSECAVQVMLHTKKRLVSEKVFNYVKETKQIAVAKMF